MLCYNTYLTRQYRKSCTDLGADVYRIELESRKGFNMS